MKAVPEMDSEKDTGQFLNDLALGKPVLAPALAALKTGDENAMLDFVATSGYKITAAGLQGALASAEPGPNFDIRHVAGFYSFEKPANSGLYMTVDSSTARIYINEKVVDNKTDDKGRVHFAYGSYEYDIAFESGYNNDGSLKPITFKGSRTTASKTDKEEVEGTEIIYKDKEDFFRSHGAVEASWIMGSIGFVLGVLGTSWSVISWAYNKVVGDRANKQKAPAATQDRADRAVATASDVARSLLEKPDFKIGVFQIIENKIKSEVQNKLRQAEDTTKVDVSQVAADTAASSIQEVVEEHFDALASSDSIARLRAIVGTAAFDNVKRQVTNATVSSLRERFGSGTEYIKSISTAEKIRHDMNANTHEVETRSQEVDVLTSLTEQAKVRAGEQDVERQQYLDSLKDEEKTAEALKENQKYQSLSDAIAKEKRAMSENQTKKEKAEDEGTEAQKEADDLREKLRNQETEAKEKGDLAFEG